MKTYRKTATVEAKVFEKGDEDGMTWTSEELRNGREDVHLGIGSTEGPEATIPYINTIENEKFTGAFGDNYICVGVDGERWLVVKDIFERTYELV